MSIDRDIDNAVALAREESRLTTLRDVRKVLYMAHQYEAARLVEEMEGREAGPVAKAADAYVAHAFGSGRWDDHVRAEKAAREYPPTLTTTGPVEELFGGGR